MTNSYDICAIFISIILIVYLVKFRSIRNYQNTIFVMLLIDNAITAIAETIESMLILNRSIRYIATEVYFLSHILVIPLLFIYIMSLVVNWYSINNILRYLILAPSFASIVLVLINPLVDFVFTYNDSGYYERGLGVYLIYAFAMYYFLLIVFILLRYRDIMSIVQKGVIVSSLFIIIGSAVKQIFNPDIRIEVFAISFSTFSFLIRLLSIEFFAP